jgi:hypothetical protein
MLDAALRGSKATIPAQAVQEQEMVSTEPVQVTNDQANTPGATAVQTANDGSTETPVVTTNTPTPTPVKTATPVVNTTTDADGEGGTPGATKTTSVTPTPAPTETEAETKAPTWQEIVSELTEMDNQSEESKAKMKKKQRIATAIAALGDLATHAINVWGASNGYNAPIKGAPLTEGVTAKHKLDLAEHDARLERLKRLKLDAAEARKKDAADKLKLRELHLKEAKEERAATIDALRLQLAYEKHALDKAKTEDEKKLREKKIKLLEAQIKATNAGVQQGWAKVENYKERTKAQNAKAARGKQTAFSDGKGNNLAIYDNVWKGSMQQVYDILEQELRAEDEKKNGYQAKKRWEERNTAAEKNDFVKQNWHKSERARKLMEVLASLDPAAMASTGLGWGEEAQTADENTDLDW